MQNYNPYGYNNYNGYNFNQYPQQPQTNQYAFVNGIEGAKSYQVQPNQTVLLMDSDASICYMKQANSIGQSTLRYFKLVETSEQELKGVTHQTEYVLKSDFDALNSKVNELINSLTKKEGKE